MKAIIELLGYILGGLLVISLAGPIVPIIIMIAFVLTYEKVKSWVTEHSESKIVGERFDQVMIVIFIIFLIIFVFFTDIDLISSYDEVHDYNPLG